MLKRVMMKNPMKILLIPHIPVNPPPYLLENGRGHKNSLLQMLGVIKIFYHFSPTPPYKSYLPLQTFPCKLPELMKC